MNKQRMTFIVGLIALAALMRFIPHPANFSPVAAMALFGGAYLTDKRLAFIVPLLVMLITDSILGFHSIIPFVYAAFAITVVIGIRLGKKPKSSHLLFSALGSGILFYLITNFGVWLISGMYPKNIEGLLNCYTMGLPFIQNTLLSNLIFSFSMFGLMRLLDNTVSLSKRKIE